jgi:thymidylate synthase ThyX
MYKAKLHKQCYNRLTEPFQQIKVIASATDWQNFFWLRNDKAADPTLEALAKKMEEAYNDSVPQELQSGQWHLPFVETNILYGKQYYWVILTPTEKIRLSVEEAIKVSAARCAAVSYRNEDYGLEKCLQLYERLVGDERKHASALEHQAKVMGPSTYEAGVIFDMKDYQLSPAINIASAPQTWQEGTTHVDRKGVLWSGNFRGFIQHRQLIEGQNKESY